MKSGTKCSVGDVLLRIPGPPNDVWLRGDEAHQR